MSNPEKLSLHGRHLLNRREFLGTSGLSAAGLGLTALLCKEGLL
ncbi:MAG: twin-arginine translocation signal domain-containing protein, partial [Pirellulales bacterium]|nr:twin-arginine translocation signal domain-containing protein [Pirellulales bacterium]